MADDSDLLPVGMPMSDLTVNLLAIAAGVVVFVIAVLLVMWLAARTPLD